MIAPSASADAPPAVPLSDLAAMSRDVAPALETAWREITASSSFIGGPWVRRFEEEWAEYCGRALCVGVANGTDSIELILRALGVGAGDEVIVPTNTFIATAEGVMLAGATPRFADIDPGTLMITAEAIADAITPRTAAVIAVDLYGNMPDMGAVAEIAGAHGLALIEDAAQAQGSMWRGARAGSFGVASSFSFYPGKNLGAFGDAGAVVTDDAALAGRIRQLANHGRTPEDGNAHVVVARNSRLDGLQAGVLSAKLTMLDEWNRARRAAAAMYTALLDPGLVEVLEVRSEVESVHHQFVVQVDDRDEVRAELADRGVDSAVHYPVPCHRQPAYTEFAPGSLPIAERAAGRIVSLPLFPHISEPQVEHVTASLNAAVRGR